MSAATVLPDRPSPLSTDRLRLEPRCAEHAKALVAALADADVYRFIPQDTPTLADLEARYRRTAAGPAVADERWWNWAVFPSAEREVGVGTVEFTIYQATTTATASLGYLFGRATWGTGFAFEACTAAIAFVRSYPSIARIEANVDTRNVSSIALAERLGFVRTATIRDADLFKGSTSDEFVYVLALR